jgi:hypothetical protein
VKKIKGIKKQNKKEESKRKERRNERIKKAKMIYVKEEE